MSNRIVFQAYNNNSESVQSLLETFRERASENGSPKVFLIRSSGSKYTYKPGDLCICWGNVKDSQGLFANVPGVLNRPSATKVVTNKGTFFKKIEEHASEAGPRVPDHTWNKSVVAEWLSDNKTAFARTVLAGHSGEGIIDVTSFDVLNTIPDNTLFVKYVPKKYEWRVHVFKDKVIDIQKKSYRTRETACAEIPANWRIRNHSNGFIFERGFDPNTLSKDVVDQAVAAVKFFGLDFGAVDVIFNLKQDKAYVLEINTAPGLEGSSVTNYVESILNYNKMIRE